MDRTFVFRTIQTPREFLDYALLRYSINNFMGYLDQHNEARIDLDKFDRLSIPFGAFEVDGAKEILQGTMRIITTD